jgi:hypothetical protein
LKWRSDGRLIIERAHQACLDDRCDAIHIVEAAIPDAAARLLQGSLQARIPGQLRMSVQVEAKDRLREERAHFVHIFGVSTYP